MVLQYTKTITMQLAVFEILLLYKEIIFKKGCQTSQQYHYPNECMAKPLEEENQNVDMEMKDTGKARDNIFY